MACDSQALTGRPPVQVGLTFRDLDRARQFSRDVLGLPLLFEAGAMLFLQLGGMGLMVGREQAPGAKIGGSLLHFDAPDIDALGRALEGKGVAFLGEATTVQRTSTHDLT